MKNTIKHILKEDRREKYFDTVAENFVKGSEAYRLNLEFESASDLRDMGYDDNMTDFAFNNYEKYGFSYDEDAGYYTQGDDEGWSESDMTQEMYYYYIEDGVKDGVFGITDTGWDIITNDFEISTTHGYYILEYQCRDKSYMRNYNPHEIERILLKTYGLPHPIDQERVTELIYKKFTEILDPLKKVC